MVIATSLIGTVIKERYKLIDERGSGSMATVYVCRDIETNTILAAKVLNAETKYINESLPRFKREAEILEKIQDEHIVQIIEYGEENGLHYIIMEYIDGYTLKHDILLKSPYDLHKAVNIIQQVAEGLDAAAKHSVIHRDIKPQNILISADEKVKITDFGLARTSESATMTNAHLLMGTPYYISPEQVKDSHSAEHRSDLYSLACVFYEMLTGHVLYDGANAMEVLFKHISEPIPSATSIDPGLPAIVDNFFQKALAKNAADRYQSSAAFIEGLNRLVASPKPALPPKSLQMVTARLTLLATGQMYTLTTAKSLIGRSDPKQGIFPQVDLSSIDTDRSISRRHAMIHYHDENFWVEDLKAFNTTKINSKAILPGQQFPLKSGDILRIGNFDLCFEA